MQILAISGSLRASSSNAAVLRAAAQLAPPGVEVSVSGRDLDAAGIVAIATHTED